MSAGLVSGDVDRSGQTRVLLFVLAFCLAWITLKPFGDNGASDALDISTGRETTTYMFYAVLAVAAATIVRASDAPALKCLVTRENYGLAACVAASVMVSPDIGLSAKRAAVLICVTIIAAALPLLPRSRAQMAEALAWPAGMLLALSYFGVVFLPQYAVHQATDLIEPQLAGDWRGVFSHKNDASIIFAIVVYVGIFIARARSMALGVCIALAAAVFLFKAAGKSANMLWLPTLLIGLPAAERGATWAWRALALAPVLFLNLIGLGSVAFGPVKDLVAKMPIDPTFTGRTDIWRYAMDKVAAKPWLGYGYDAFWNTPAVRFQADSDVAWVGDAAHAHNAYLNTAVSMGCIGLTFAIWVLVLRPLADVMIFMP